MQQGTGRFFSHARIAVGGSGNDSLKKAEHATHFGDPVKSGDDMHFRSARICEAGVYASREQRPN
jgi:hypothetical protein